MLRRILYTSRAMPGITMKDVYDIIRVSHNRNSQCGITGGLLFIDGHFIQMMEGLPASIDTRFEKIRQDGRHQDIVIRQETDVVTPVFCDDWMALRDGSKIDPSVLATHGYVPSLPIDQFDGERVLQFLLACFEQESVAV